MTLRSLSDTQRVFQSLAPAARTTGTATGAAIDLRGFDSAAIVVSFGAYTDGTHTPSVLHSADGSVYTPCVYGTDLKGPSPLAAVAGSSGANKIQTIDYVGNKRYVAVVMTTAGATTGAFSAASVVAGHPHRAPTA